MDGSIVHSKEFYDAYFENRRKEILAMDLPDYLREAINTVDRNGEPTNDTLGSEDIALGIPQLNIQISPDREHVGQLSGKTLAYWIEWGLKRQCIDWGVFSGKNVCKTNRVTIDHVEYNAKGKKADNAFIGIVAERNGAELMRYEKPHENNLPKSYGKNLLEAWIYLTAALYGRISDDSVYRVWLEKDKKVAGWSNVPRFIRFTTYNNARNAQFGVWIQFNGPTKEGDFDCYKHINSVAKITGEYDAMLSKGFNVPLGSMARPNIWCS
jgi:hypothetical protein